MSLPFLTERNGATLLSVLVTPRSSRNKIQGVIGNQLKVALSAAPVDGKANAQLVEVIAKSFNLPKRAVRVLQGEASKQKVVEVVAAPAAIERALGELLATC